MIEEDIKFISYQTYFLTKKIIKQKVLREVTTRMIGYLYGEMPYLELLYIKG
jgi:hypothetical protein